MKRFLILLLPLLTLSGCAQYHALNGCIINQAGLIAAASGGQLDCIRVNAKHGSDLNSKYQGILSPLQAAVQSSEIAATHLLLDLGADPNSATNLMFAPDEIREILINAGRSDLIRQGSSESNGYAQLAETAAEIHSDSNDFSSEEPSPNQLTKERYALEKELKEEKALYEEKKRDLARKKAAAEKKARDQKTKRAAFGAFAGLLVGAAAIDHGVDSETASDLTESTFHLTYGALSGDTAALQKYQENISELERRLESNKVQQDALSQKIMHEVQANLNQGNQKLFAACSPVRGRVHNSMRNECSLDPQSKTLCENADLYYRRYVEMCRDGNQDPSEMYQAHTIAAQQAMRFMRDYKEGVFIGSNKKSDSTSEAQNENRKSNQNKSPASKKSCAPGPGSCVEPI